MSPRIGVIGVGWSGFTPTTAGRSYKELMFEAASAAYQDAGVDPRTEVDSFVCASEDIEEGTSIFDEYVPDQLGAVQRPVQTVAADGLFGAGTAVMLIRSGVAGWSRSRRTRRRRDVVTHGRIDRSRWIPCSTGPWACRRWRWPVSRCGATWHASGQDRRRSATDVAARNREHGRGRIRAAPPRRPGRRRPLFDPLTTRPGRAERRRVRRARPGRRGPGRRRTGVDRRDRLEPGRALGREPRLVPARSRPGGGRDAYAQAGVGPRDVDLAEVDDTFAYKQLQHLDAMGLGALDPAPREPIGGALGEGYLHEANGLARTLARVEQPARRRGARSPSSRRGAACRARAGGGGVAPWR